MNAMNMVPLLFTSFCCGPSVFRLLPSFVSKCVFNI